MTNPLIAERQDSTTAVTGIGIAESAVDIYNGVQNGSWVEGGIGALGGGLEVLSLVLDPLGTLGQYAVSWVIEHVAPLRDALNWLAGDADQIAAYSQTWKNVSQAVAGVAADYQTEITNGTAGWSGPAADAYRTNASQQGEHITAAGTGADTIGTVVEVVGVLVGVVRGIVRDLVAECISTLLIRLPQWLAELGLTLGLATPHVVASVAALVSKWVGRVTDIIAKLTRSLEKLRPLMNKLGEIWEAVKRGLQRLRTASRGAESPDAPDMVRSATPTTTPSGSATPTTPSSATPSTPSTSTTPSGSATPTTPSSATPSTPSASTTPSGSATPTTPSSATPSTPSTTATPTGSATPTPGTGSPTPPTPRTPTPTSPGSGPHWRDEVRGKFTPEEYADFERAMDKLGTDPVPGTPEVPGSGQLTPHERDLMARAMNEVTVKPDTLMQKVIPEDTVTKYLDGTYGPQVGGFVARNQDAGVLQTPADLITGNRLDYVDSPYSPSQSNIHVLEFPATDPGMFPTPVGAPHTPDLPASSPQVIRAQEEMIQAARDAGVDPSRYTSQSYAWPYSGAGVTAHPTMGVPEFEMSGRMNLPDGSAIYAYDAAGSKVLVATYNSASGWVRP
ncbi:WXG100 family type VII secretion target [Actinokineospora sp. HUAS TT18]|uniref:WXG100 family type VII secretion target n=1 Tax=Actinokineospora sp. HUAS TT18 TaxID=3447451 RepID=UPI003F51B648